MGVALVGRLRKDPALGTLPTLPGPGALKKPRPKPKYGGGAIGRAQSTSHSVGWQQAEVVLFDKTIPKTFKTFLATKRSLAWIFVFRFLNSPPCWRSIEGVPRKFRSSVQPLL
jgi:hypothetical protein